MDEFLTKVFGYWQGIAKETSEKLGADASLFLYSFNDALDIHHSITENYSKHECQTSLVALELGGLLKELYWMQFLFLASNYPIVMGRLRFNWEQIFRAFHADCSSDSGNTVDDKHEWLMQQESNGRLNWNSVIMPILKELFDEEEGVRAQFRPLWDRLNSFVHPSGRLRELMIGDRPLKVRDGFDEALSGSTLADAQEVFGLIWLALVKRFPKIVTDLRSNRHIFEAFPQVRAAVDYTN